MPFAENRPPGRSLFGTLLIVPLLAFAVYAAKFALFALVPAHPGTQESLIIEVTRGEGPTEITQQLVKNDIVSSGRDFVFLGRILRKWHRIKAGEYKVSGGMSPLQIFAIVTSGISVPHPITVREGENMYEVASDIESKGLATRETVLGLCKDRGFIASLGFRERLPSLEGYLFPDTYFFNKTLTPQEMVRQMVKHFLAHWTPEMDERAGQLGMTRPQIVTLASIIEKETGAPNERPMISSVFYNRLHKHMRLQSDPTTIYGMWSRYKGNIRTRDLLTKNDYNTYTLPALPVGPIANPGKDSLHAALYPAETQFLYFVSHNDGTHQFSKTLAEHNAAVKKFQLDPKAREGKSWRDLYKKPQKH